MEESCCSLLDRLEQRAFLFPDDSLYIPCLFSLNSEVEDRKNVLPFLYQVALKKSDLAEVGLAPFKLLISNEIDFLSKDNIGMEVQTHKNPAPGL